MSDLPWRTSDGFAAALLSQLPSAVVVTDVDGTIVCWNRLAEQLYGYPESATLGATLSELHIGPTDNDETRAISRSVLNEGAWSGEYDTRRADGCPIRVSANVARITDADWHFQGFVAVSVEVTGPTDLDVRSAYETCATPALVSTSSRARPCPNVLTTRFISALPRR